MCRGRKIRKELGVELKREPGERMPVGALHGCEGPLEIVDTQAGQNVLIMGDVVHVIEIDELISQGGEVQQQCEQEQTRGNPGRFDRRCAFQRLGALPGELRGSYRHPTADDTVDRTECPRRDTRRHEAFCAPLPVTLLNVRLNIGQPRPGSVQFRIQGE